MECNTLSEARVLIIDIVALKEKNEICEQNYAARHILPKSVEDDSGKNVDTTQKRYNTTCNGKRIKTNCGSIRESKTQHSKFFFDVSDK